MKCEEFKNKVADLFDVDVDPEVKAACMEHIDSCAECRDYYEDLKETMNMLMPKHSPLDMTIVPQQSPVKPIKRRRWMSIAASLLIFIVGVAVGFSGLFSTSVSAKGDFTMQTAINNYISSDCWSAVVHVRTLPNENFAYFDPSLPFIPITVDHRGNIWRVEKKNGRTVVFDGVHQYMWIPGIVKYMGDERSGFLEGFATFIKPLDLLRMQQDAEKKSDAKTVLTKTDSALVLTTYTTVDGTKILDLLNDKKQKPLHCIIENIFDKDSKQLCKVNVWVEKDGVRTLMLYTDAIRRGVAMEKVQLLNIPDKNASDMKDVSSLKVVKSSERLNKFQNESARDAAIRIMTALTTGKTENAEEALEPYPVKLLLLKFKGCKVSSFSQPKEKKDYPGVFVFYTLTDKDGNSATAHIAIRKDNEQGIWIADGGL